jgi:hypothetical protein
MIDYLDIFHYFKEYMKQKEKQLFELFELVVDG